MILAPLFSWRGPWVRREQVLVVADALLYILLALAAAAAAPTGIGSLAVYLSVSTALASWRHVGALRSKTRQNDTSEGYMREPPVVFDDPTPTPATPLNYAFVGTMCAATLRLLLVHRRDDAPPPAAPVLLLLVGAWGHFWRARGHGDHDGFKHLPTVVAIMIHLAGAVGGAAPAVTLSLHRAMILVTYFFTGFRKVRDARLAPSRPPSPSASTR